MKNLTIQNVFSQYESAGFVQDSIALFKKNSTQKLYSRQFFGSVISFYAAQLYKQLNQNILLLVNDKEEAVYLLNDLEEIYSKNEVLFFPNSYKRPYEIEETSNANIVLRTEVLRNIGLAGKPKIIVTYGEALFEKVVTKGELDNKTLKIKVGEEYGTDFLNEVLFSYQFKRVDFVTSPGEFSVRGGIIDVFSFSSEVPYRISMFGDEVETIRMFDLETQLSVDKVNEISVVSNIEDKFSTEKRESFLSFIPKDTIIITNQLEDTKLQIERYFSSAESQFVKLHSTIKRNPPEELFLNSEQFVLELDKFKRMDIGFQEKDAIEIKAKVKPQPTFNKQFDLLIDNLNGYERNGFKNYLFCSNESQLERLGRIFEDIGKEVRFIPVLGTIYQGFIDEDLKMVCYTDHQIFERYHKFKARNNFSKKEAITLKEITSLQIGDYVTHIDYGIGKFAGLKKIDNNGQKQEAIKLIYQNNDILYVNIHSLHKIAKYSGKDGVEPKISKLGSPAWKNLKNKTKTRVKEIAFDLIKLYAKRRANKGFAFSPDTYLQNELEASFIYEDTPDQFSATQSVKSDMESERSMDRLICGDVGFGKTEVAIRAAFKAATDGKQVAILVPTTILAFQHFKTFSDRLEEFPVTVAYLNRFTSAIRKKVILEELKSGKIDIIIGTHQLVNANVKFKDLGLLIIDEEHKFGVGVKDKLKTMRENIDTLTLTATPIPRTLQFSLMAARDLSVIKTPPPNRQAVDTQLIGLHEEAIRDAIIYELQRGGQVYFIHNRVQSLKDIAGMIQRLVPDARIATGHGQMDGKQLENTMLDFIEGKFDILISTTIVESGLDVPNANTIFINDAQNFGLADLHQMRGRVGRSNRKAFCYLITPGLSVLTSEARKRLQAIEQFSDLGSGFNISMKDLEIRGAGNLLGAEQSGFMMDIGFETYQKILNEAIEELKESEFKDLFPEDSDTDKSYVSDVQIDTDLQLMIPDDYVNNTEERLALYSELTGIDTEEQLSGFETRLIDRFGTIPREVSNLLTSIKIKWLCRDLGFEKLVLKLNTMIGYFISKPQSEFYQSEQFRNILSILQVNPKLAAFKEKKTQGTEIPTLLLRFENIKNVDDAYEKLSFLKVAKK